MLLTTRSLLLDVKKTGAHGKRPSLRLVELLDELR